jgi:hypothetical protein
MPALPAKGEGGVLALPFTAEWDTIGKQPVDQIRPRFHHPAHDRFVAQPVSGPKCILHMGFKVIQGGNRRGDAALGVIRVALAAFLLGHNPDGAGFGRMKSELKPGNPRPDYQTTAYDCISNEL